MSFSRLNYDDCSYEKAVKQSTDVGKYNYNMPLPCNKCFVESPYIRSQYFSGGTCQDKSLIDVDSELMGLNYKNTKCPSREFDPTKGAFCQIAEEKGCGTNAFLDTEPTRISNHPCTLRGTGWNRWEWLCTNPQDNAFNILPFERLANSQIMAKDNHRACIPQLVDQQKSLPLIKVNNAQPQTYTFKATPQLIQHNNLRTCEEIKRL